MIGCRAASVTTAIDTWEALALADQWLRRDALATVRVLAAISNGDGFVSATMQDIGDMFPDGLGLSGIEANSQEARVKLKASRGLRALEDRGWIRVLNSDAARSVRRAYLLTVPAAAFAQ